MGNFSSFLKNKIQNSSQHFQVALQVLDPSPRKLARMIRTGWAMYQGRRTAPKPLFLHVEATGACNLRCSLCPRTTSITRDLRHMQLENFKRACDEVSPIFLAFVGFGEPLLNPHILDMVRYSVEKNITTRISTNATLLTPRLSRDLMATGIHQIWFSIDSPVKENFESIRVGADFDKTIAGIKEFVAIHREQKSKMAMTVTCTLTCDNIREVASMIRFCHEELRIFPSFARSYGYDIESQQSRTLKNTPEILSALDEGIALTRTFKLPAVENNLKTIKADLGHSLDGQGPCYFPYYAVAVSWNGEMTPCCLYYDYQMDLGNVFQQPFEQIWNGEAYQRFRIDLKTRRNEFKICNTCPLNDVSLHNLMAKISQVLGLGLLTKEKFELIQRPEK